MTEKMQVYKCEVCGNMTEVVHTGSGTMVCCGQNMRLMVEGEIDAATEKHLPVVEKIDGGYKIKVGQVAHPMGDEHYIEWIELIADGKAYRQFLNSNDTPEAIFKIDAKSISARAYCNLHGLWKV